MIETETDIMHNHNISELEEISRIDLIHIHILQIRKLRAKLSHLVKWLDQSHSWAEPFIHSFTQSFPFFRKAAWPKCEAQWKKAGRQHSPWSRQASFLIFVRLILKCPQQQELTEEFHSLCKTGPTFVFRHFNKHSWV